MNEQIPDIQELEEQIQKDLDSFKVTKKLFYWVGIIFVLIATGLSFTGYDFVYYGVTGVFGYILLTDSIRESKQQVLEYHLHKLQHLNGILVADIQSLSLIARYSGTIEIAKKNWEAEIKGLKIPLDDTKLH